MRISGGIGSFLAALGLSSMMVAAAVPAGAADLDDHPSAMGYSHHHHHHGYFLLPPERHVIEVVRGAYGGDFIINGTPFRAKTESCLGWVAGDRIKLLEGSWHGACVDAVFRNLSRRQTCEMWCG